MKIGIIKERKTPPDRRVVFSPEKLVDVVTKYPKFEVKVEKSDIRIFPDSAYRDKGFTVTEDMSDCDVLLGVKEVPADTLIPHKKYFFFSHTIKKQPYNRDLLRAILEKNIQLYDHETITDEQGRRLIGFGRYAGIVGAYNGFRAYGLREKTYELSTVEDLPDYKRVIEELKKIDFPQDFKIVFSGGGKVAGGIREILEHLDIKEVGVDEYLNSSFDEPVFCQTEVLDYNKRKDGEQKDFMDFYENPGDYESNFMRFAKVSNYFISGHFYDKRSPYLFTREDAKSAKFKIDLVADVSCDIDGPVASTIRPSTIADPFYGYDPQTGKEVNFDDDNAITVMAVDNLPCELPKDASDGFGAMFLENVIPALFNDDKNGILHRAQMTKDGKLTPKFSYLQDFVDGKE